MECVGENECRQSATGGIPSSASTAAAANVAEQKISPFNPTHDKVSHSGRSDAAVYGAVYVNGTTAPLLQCAHSSPIRPTLQALKEAMALLFADLATDSREKERPRAVFYDLGCGDGRMLRAAAQVDGVARCVGVEIDPEFADRAQKSLSALSGMDVWELAFASLRLCVGVCIRGPSLSHSTPRARFGRRVESVHDTSFLR